MCLHIPHEASGNRFPKIERINYAHFKNHRFGVKAFKDRDGNLYPLHFGLLCKEPLPVEQWIDECNYRQSPTLSMLSFGIPNYGTYMTGWHIYVGHDVSETLRMIHTNRKSSLRYVLFRRVTRMGWEFLGPCVVAKEIYILPARPVCSDICEYPERLGTLMNDYSNPRVKRWMSNQPKKVQKQYLANFIKCLAEESQRNKDIETNFFNFLLDTPQDVAVIYIYTVDKMERWSPGFHLMTTMHMEMLQDSRYKKFLSSIMYYLRYTKCKKIYKI